jgi:hypothetical protein
VPVTDGIPFAWLSGQVAFSLLPNKANAVLIAGAGRHLFHHHDWWERIWFAVGGLLLIDPGTLSDINGTPMLVGGASYQWWRKKADKEQVVTAVAPNLSA